MSWRPRAAPVPPPEPAPAPSASAATERSLAPLLPAVKQALLSRGMSQAQLCAQLGLRPEYLSLLLHGKLPVVRRDAADAPPAAPPPPRGGALRRALLAALRRAEEAAAAEVPEDGRPSLRRVRTRLLGGGYESVEQLQQDVERTAPRERAAAAPLLRRVYAAHLASPLWEAEGEEGEEGKGQGKGEGGEAEAELPSAGERAALLSQVEGEVVGGRVVERRRAEEGARGTWGCEYYSGAMGAGGVAGAEPHKEVRAMLRWAAEHLPGFAPAPQPCDAFVDGRHRVVLLGTTEREPAAPSSGPCEPCEPTAAERWAVVGYYFCARPVIVAAARIELRPLSVTPLGRTHCRVKWADGAASTERAARFAAAPLEEGEEEGEAEGEGEARGGAPAGWEELLRDLPHEAAARLRRDGAAWGFGLCRADGFAAWPDASDALLRRHLHAAPRETHALCLAALAPILGWPLSRLRERWAELRRAASPASPASPPHPPAGKDVAPPLASTAARLAAVSSRIDALLASLSSRDALFPAAAWRAASAAPLRRRLQQLEAQTHAAEAALSLAPAAAAAPSRGYSFYIDDITHHLPHLPPPSLRRPPIGAVNEVDAELFPDLLYLHASLAGDGVPLDAHTEFLTGCNCEGECDAAAGCACVREQLVAAGCSAYDAAGLLRAAVGTPLYECNAACRCPRRCANRVVQRGISRRLQVFKTRAKGWAVRTLEPIPAGAFVCEYVGEVITTDEAERRGVEYDRGGFSTLFDLDAAGRECEYTIDATYKCGVARFLNHSCAPNLHQFSVWVDTVSLALPRIAFFALRAVEPMEELTFDYKYEQGGRTLECHCGAPNCRKWLL
ncbi:hypothetical protein AB1Y20_008776 [Prymnesium parvum]|uniref:Histone-lysine N-methyltransferase n=1 Tax=Prymnesium parvum TaxID=97485 RepID=A0AB34IUT9_PRYPA